MRVETVSELWELLGAWFAAHTNALKRPAAYWWWSSLGPIAEARSGSRRGVG